MSTATMSATSSRKDRAPLSGSASVFFVVTFFLTWACWAPIVLVPLHARTLPFAILLFIGIFSPAIVSVSLTARSKGRAGVRELFQGMLKANMSARWYVFAVCFTISIKLFNALLLRAFTGTWPRFGDVSLFLIPLAIMISTPVQSGEEIGWRGYALPRLAARMGLAKSSILLGIIWALWHLPLFFVPDSDTYHQSFFVYTLQVTALSVAMAWLWERTGRSLLLVMLMHAAVNNTQDIVVSAIPGGARAFGFTASPLAWLGVAVLWIFALYFLKNMGNAVISDGAAR